MHEVSRDFISEYSRRPQMRTNPIELCLWLGLSTLTVILPNALKEIAVMFLLLTAAYYVFWKRYPINFRLLAIWLAIAGTSLLYILVGMARGAPLEAGSQVLIIYILSPLLWIISLNGALATFGLARIVVFLLFLTSVAIASQAFYYWAFPSGRFSVILTYMAGVPNLDFSNNQVAAVMFVFGSMTFLYAGLFASPDVLKLKSVRLFLIIASFVSAVTSGRSAVILSVGIGAFIYFVSSIGLSFRMSRSLLFGIVAIILGPVVGGYFLSDLYGIDIFVSVNELIEKITSGGGAGRQDYLPSLISGAADFYFLGAGHGIGVDFTVSEKYPWRYEVVGAATLLRVGLAGTIIYCLPFILALRAAVQKARRRGLDKYEKYMLGGLISSLFVMNTNPYVEAVVFQWMFVLPCTYFINCANAGQRTP